MDNQEAIASLKTLCHTCKFFPKCVYEKPECFQAIEMAVSALEKQIPKKPIRIDKNKEFDGNWKKTCPLCGRVLMERITTSESSYPRHYNYTGYCLCGQAIDWEGEV